jgi:hypothetical protein
MTLIRKTVVAGLVVGLAAAISSCVPPTSGSDGIAGAPGASGSVSVVFASPSNATLDVLAADGLIVAAGYDGSLATSNDGVTWTTVADSYWSSSKSAYAPVSVLCQGVLGGSKVIVAAGAQGRLYLGRSATDWELTSAAPPTYTVKGAAIGAGYLVAALDNGEGSTVVERTADGTTWTTANQPSGLNSASALFFAYDRFFLAAYDTNGDLAVSSSPDAWTWTAVPEVTAPYSPGLRSLVYGNGVYLASFGSGNTVLRSTDGTHWTATYSGLGNVTKVIWGNNHFWLLGTDSMGRPKVLKTADGLVWDYPALDLPWLDVGYTGLAWSPLVGASGGLVLSFKTSANTPATPIDTGNSDS